MQNRGWIWQQNKNSLLSSDAGPPPGTPKVFLNGDNIDGLNNSTLTAGNPIASWTNLGSLGGTLTQASGTLQPLFNTNQINGFSAVTFDGTNDTMVSSLAASNFTFMHSGTGATVYSVAKTSVSGIRTILATGTGSGTTVSMGHRINTNFAASYFMSDGVALQINSNGAASSVSTNLFDIQTSTLASANTPNLSIFVNGTSRATATAGGFSSSPPAATLCVGANSANSFNFAGPIALILVYDVAHDSTQRAAVEAWIASKYAVTFPS